MKKAEYFQFMPFGKRQLLYPDDKVIGLKLYPYHKEDIEHIKQQNKKFNKLFANKERLINFCGGWLPNYQCWFFEVPMFEKVIKGLLDSLGYSLQEITDNKDNG